MGMSDFYGSCDDWEFIVILYVVLEQGVILIDIVDMYGLYINEELVGKVIIGCWDWVFLVIKFGVVCDSDNLYFCGVDGSFDYVCCLVEGSFKCLGVDYIDFYYQYCIDL